MNAQPRKETRYRGPQLATFIKGKVARHKGKAREECPYVTTRGRFREAWLAGWDDSDRAFKKAQDA